MGSALLKGWLDAGFKNITVLDPNFSDKTVASVKSAQELASKPFDIIVLAVKPQVMTEVFSELRSASVNASLFLSIAAGKSLSFFAEIFGPDLPFIRSMPNTPALIGQGFTAAIGNKAVTAAQKDLAQNLLTPLGQVEWIEDESLMDAVTAVSGSGPAYLFLLIEELAKAAQAQGIPENLAMRMARQTVIGAAALAASQPETPAAELRNIVTSPGGTTEAALRILMSHDGLGRVLQKAVAAAAERSREL